jgi:hypothetical protein
LNSIKNVVRGENKKNINQIIEKNLNQYNHYNKHTQNDNTHMPDIKERRPSIETNNMDKRGSNNFNSSSFAREESKLPSNNPSNTSSSTVDSKIVTKNTIINQNISQTHNNSHLQHQKTKTSMQNYLHDEEDGYKKQKEPAISIKMDPNSNDLKDMKVNVNMDAETAYNFYQSNKKYLPTTQQVMSGAKATANFVEKNSSALTSEDDTSTNSSMITGNKSQSKKINDPLTSLFGSGGNKTAKTNNSSNTSATTNTKKGMF